MIGTSFLYVMDFAMEWSFCVMDSCITVSLYYHDTFYPFMVIFSRIHYIQKHNQPENLAWLHSNEEAFRNNQYFKIFTACPNSNKQQQQFIKYCSTKIHKVAVFLKCHQTIYKTTPTIIKHMCGVNNQLKYGIW